MAAGTSTADTRAQRTMILECALEIGQQGGEQALTMRAIANRLGVNQAVLYSYFEDKAALVRELTRVASDRLESWLAEGTAPHVDAGERLFHLCLAQAEFARVHPWMYRLAFEDAHIAVGTPDGWQDHAFVVRATVLLADVFATSPAFDPVLVARQLCVAIHGLAMALASCEPEPTFIERYVRALVDGPVAVRLGPDVRSATTGSTTRDLDAQRLPARPRPTRQTA